LLHGTYDKHLQWRMT